MPKNQFPARTAAVGALSATVLSCLLVTPAHADVTGAAAPAVVGTHADSPRHQTPPVQEAPAPIVPVADADGLVPASAIGKPMELRTAALPDVQPGDEYVPLLNGVQRQDVTPTVITDERAGDVVTMWGSKATLVFSDDQAYVNYEVRRGGTVIAVSRGVLLHRA